MKTTLSTCNIYIDCNIRIAKIPSFVIRNRKSEIRSQNPSFCHLPSVFCSLSSVIRLSTTQLLLELMFCFIPVLLILSWYTSSLLPDYLCTFSDLLMSRNNSLFCLFSYLFHLDWRCFSIPYAGRCFLFFLCPLSNIIFLSFWELLSRAR